MIYVTHDQVEAMTMGDRIVVMKDGHIQQIDRPLHLYEHPANKFVAGFIGSPSMNFVPGLLTGTGDLRFEADGGAFSLPVASTDDGALATYRGRRVDMGFRPEHLTVTPGEDTAPMEVDLDVVEPLGNEVFLYGRAGEHAVVARVAPINIPSPGQRVTLHADLRRLHYFDAETELSLRVQPESVMAS